MITGAYEPLSACHIFSFRFANDQFAKEELWSALKVFWTEEKVDSWMKVVLDDRGVVNTEQVRHVITLASPHYFWDKCYFALKPLRNSGTTLSVEFWWLPKLARAQVPRRVTPGRKPDLGNIANYPANRIHLFDCVALQPIESGTEFTFTTPDQVKYPLPSFELLEMEWNFHRIAALRGAIDDEDGDDDHDENGSYYDSDDDDRSVL